jgi:hypothetical protein
VARPSLYTAELSEAICEHIAHGNSLVGFCKEDGNPSYTTVMRWLTEKPEFRDSYTRARESQAEYLAEEILAISDDGSRDVYVTDEGIEVVNHDVIARSRLRVDSRKWYAGKLQPKKYSDKQIISGDPENPLQHNHTGKVDMGLELIVSAIERVINK